MRTTTTRATAVEGIRSFRLESEKLRGEPLWRRRALDPDGEGVSPRFRGLVVDYTGRMVAR